MKKSLIPLEQNPRTEFVRSARTSFLRTVVGLLVVAGLVVVVIIVGLFNRG